MYIYINIYTYICLYRETLKSVKESSMKERISFKNTGKYSLLLLFVINIFIIIIEYSDSKKIMKLCNQLCLKETEFPINQINFISSRIHVFYDSLNL